jgi:hypothetical protein
MASLSTVYGVTWACDNYYVVHSCFAHNQTTFLEPLMKHNQNGPEASTCDELQNMSNNE